jgi:hypothetical protein
MLIVRYMCFTHSCLSAVSFSIYVCDSPTYASKPAAPRRGGRPGAGVVWPLPLIERDLYTHECWYKLCKYWSKTIEDGVYGSIPTIIWVRVLFL